MSDNPNTLPEQDREAARMTMTDQAASTGRLVDLDNYNSHPLHTPSIVWKRCLPFIVNSRAALVHRPRTVVTFSLHEKDHMAVGYWCGNGTSGRENITFAAAVPEQKLLCMYCEGKAVLAGHLPADTICGRHVHIGRTIAVRMCCRDMKS